MQRQFWYGLLILAAIFILAISYSCNLNSSYHEAKERAARAEGQAEALKKETEVFKERLKAIDATLADLRVSNHKLEEAVKNRPVPPVPGPQPVDTETRKTELIAFGLNPGLMFTDKANSTLSLSDSSLIWKWAADSRDVPTLRLNIQDRDNLVAGLKTEIKTWEASKVDSDALQLKSDQAFNAQVEATNYLKTAIAKKEREDFWNKVEYAGYGTALGIIIKSLF